MKPPKGVVPHNPFVALAKFRKAGAHEKTEKALRREAKMKLQHAQHDPSVDTADPVPDTDDNQESV